MVSDAVIGVGMLFLLIFGFMFLVYLDCQNETIEDKCHDICKRWDSQGNTYTNVDCLSVCLEKSCSTRKAKP